MATTIITQEVIKDAGILPATEEGLSSVADITSIAVGAGGIAVETTEDVSGRLESSDPEDPLSGLDALLQLGISAAEEAEEAKEAQNRLYQEYKQLVEEVEATDAAIDETNSLAATKQDLITDYVGSDDAVITHLPDKEKTLLEQLIAAGIINYTSQSIQKVVDLRATIIRLRKITDKTPEQQEVLRKLEDAKKEFDVKAREEALLERKNIDAARAKEEKSLIRKRSTLQKKIEGLLVDNPALVQMAKEQQDAAKKAEVQRAVKGLTGALNVFESVDSGPVARINALMQDEQDPEGNNYFGDLIKLYTSRDKKDKPALNTMLKKGTEVLVAAVKDGSITDAEEVVGSAANKDVLNKYVVSERVLRAQLEDPITLRDLANVDVQEATELEGRIRTALAVKDLIFKLTGNKPSKNKSVKVGEFWEAIRQQASEK